MTLKTSLFNKGIYKSTVRRYTWGAVLYFIILFMSCGILSNIVRPAFYEVATSCAFLCMSIALYHFVTSNILTDKNNIKTKT